MSPELQFVYTCSMVRIDSIKATEYMGDSRRESPYNRINLKLLQARGLLWEQKWGVLDVPPGPLTKPQTTLKYSTSLWK